MLVMSIKPVKVDEKSKPIKCPHCRRGRIGNIPFEEHAICTDECDRANIILKCPCCGKNIGIKIK